MSQVKVSDTSVLQTYSKQDWVNFLQERAYRGHKINSFAAKYDSCSYENSTHQITRTSKKGKQTIVNLADLIEKNSWTFSRMIHRIKMACSNSYKKNFNERINHLAELIKPSSDTITTDPIAEENSELIDEEPALECPVDILPPADEVIKKPVLQMPANYRPPLPPRKKKIEVDFIKNEQPIDLLNEIKQKGANYSAEQADGIEKRIQERRAAIKPNPFLSDIQKRAKTYAEQDAIDIDNQINETTAERKLTPFLSQIQNSGKTYTEQDAVEIDNQIKNTKAQKIKSFKDEETANEIFNNVASLPVFDQFTEAQKSEKAKTSNDTDFNRDEDEWL